MKEGMRMSKELSKDIAALGLVGLGVLGFPIFLVLAIALNGLVIFKFWGWFVVPYGLAVMHFSVGNRSVPLMFMQRAMALLTKTGKTWKNAGELMDVAWAEYQKSVKMTAKYVSREQPHD